MNSRKYTRLNVNLKRLSQKIVSYFERENFEVVFSTDANEPPLWYSIQARKNSTLKKIMGTRKSVEIVVRGEPDNFEVSLMTNEKRKNLMSTVISTSPIGIATLGGATIVAVGTNLYARKRFINTIWNIIDSKISDLEESGIEGKLKELEISRYSST
jgi:hypothetical protein